MLLPNGTNVNHVVKDGWCWWYREYAPRDVTLDPLQSEAVGFMLRRDLARKRKSRVISLGIHFHE